MFVGKGWIQQPEGLVGILLELRACSYLSISSKDLMSLSCRG